MWYDYFCTTFILDQLNEIQHATEELLNATEELLKWDLPQHFKTKTKKTDTYQKLIVKRSSLTFEAVEQYFAFISEQCHNLPAATKADKTIHPDDLIPFQQIKVTKVRVKEATVQRTPSPKYFCHHCRADVCKDCFKAACISHDVAWMGNKHFRCVSPFHDTCLHNR